MIIRHRLIQQKYYRGPPIHWKQYCDIAQECETAARRFAKNNAPEFAAILNVLASEYRHQAELTPTVEV